MRRLRLHLDCGRLLAAALLIALAGCDAGPGRMRVWGNVTYAAQPVSEGTIVFTPIEGTKGPSTGGSIRQGQYEVPADKGPFPGGVYRVEITALRKTGKKIPSYMFKDAPQFELAENYIPEQYNRTSMLRAQISEDAAKNQFDFTLTDK